MNQLSLFHNDHYKEILSSMGDDAKGTIPPDRALDKQK